MQQDEFVNAVTRMAFEMYRDNVSKQCIEMDVAVAQVEELRRAVKLKPLQGALLQVCRP